MVTLNFIATDGSARAVEARPGESVMQAAVRARVPGIEAQCGGALVCGTCHAFVAERWFERLPPACDGEVIMLDCGDHRAENSRLTCQITVTVALEGAVFRTPPSQP